MNTASRMVLQAALSAELQMKLARDCLAPEGTRYHIDCALRDLKEALAAPAATVQGEGVLDLLDRIESKCSGGLTCMNFGGAREFFKDIRSLIDEFRSLPAAAPVPGKPVEAVAERPKCAACFDFDPECAVCNGGAAIDAALGWLDAALKCKSWNWDADQREAAEESLEDARAARKAHLPAAPSVAGETAGEKS